MLFILSTAMAAAGIILSTRLRNRYKSDYLNALLYFQVFIFAFGFYGIWGQVIIKAVLSDQATVLLLERFSTMSMLLGLPFLVFGWLMLTRFSREVSGRKKSNRFASWFLVLNFVVLFAMGYLMFSEGENKPVTIVKYYFIILSMVYNCLSAIYILFPGHGNVSLHKYEGRILSSGLVLLTAGQCLTLALYDGTPVAGMVFVLLFFAGNCLIPVYFTYGTVLSLFMLDPERNISYDSFCKAFEITQREAEIIHEICNGLSNKEIAEKLFITLQTVKDHTHRIYIKTNVKSRVQLMNLVKDSRDRIAGGGPGVI